MTPTRCHVKLCINLGTITVLAAGACRDANGVSAGSLRVSTATTGGDIDADGYVLRFANGWSLNLAPSGIANLAGIPAGTYAVTIDGVAENCEVVGAPARMVVIDAGRIAVLGFEVWCRTAGLQVAMATDGTDIRWDAFLVMVAGRDSMFAVLPNGVVVLRGLTGTHTITVASRVPNCFVQAPTQQVAQVTAARLTTISFRGRCVAETGTVEVAVASVGVDLDPTGYRLRLRSLPGGVVPVNGATWVDRLPAGRIDIALDDVAPNCTYIGPSTRSVDVKVGGLVRDTARIRFDVSCVRTDKIAFVHKNSIVVAYADGSNAVVLREGFEPSWSPKGDRLVVEAAVCSAPPGAASAGGYPEEPPATCDRVGLFILDPETKSASALSTMPLDRNPAWSPLGDQVGFDRSGSIYLYRLADGHTRVLTLPAFSAQQIAWSPDGLVIAFSCARTSFESGICLVSADGTGVRELTSGLSVDTEPAWSPDGSKIAFTTTAFTGRDDIAIMNSDGTGLTRVTAGRSPSWFPDGTRLLFGVHGHGLGRVRLDGSGFTLITRQEEHAPAWRP